MAKKTKDPKEKFITLRRAARKYETNERNILNWAKGKKITAVHIGDTWVIDEYSLFRYFEKKKIITDYDKRLEELIVERENLLLQQENDLFVLYSFQDLTPSIRLVLEELSLLIKDEIKRKVFQEISFGHDVELVAHQYNLSVDRVRYCYTFATKVLFQKLGFLKNSRKTIAELKFKIRKLEINNQIKENEINRLLSVSPSVERTELAILTPEIIKLLSTPLYVLNFDTRVLNCFQWFKITTVEELLRFTKDSGLRTLMSYRSFGKKSLASLKAVLLANNIIDIDGNSNLYKFV